MTRRIKTALFAGALLLLFSSCRVGKPYQQPHLGLPEAIAQQRDSLSIDSIRWQSVYRDPALQSLIQRTLDNNKELKIAAARMREMAALKQITLLNQLPDVAIQLTGQKEQLNYGGDSPKADPEWNVKGQLSWELDLWGRLRYAHDADIAAFMQSVEARYALQVLLIAEVASNYYELCALDNELSIVEQTLLARREGVRLAKLRYEGGLTSETVYNQTLLELARTETLLPALERDIQIKENELTTLLGEYVGEVIPRGLSLSDQPLPEQLPEGLSSTLLTRRPDIRLSEQKLREANARMGVAYASMFPRIGLTANLGMESDELSTLLKSPARFIAGNILQPLLGMAKYKASHKAAVAHYEQELLQYEQQVMQAFREVSNALISRRKASEIRESQSELEEAASNHVRLAQLQYINGVVNYYDVLDAQRGLLDAQLSLNDAILAEQLAVVELYKVLGGGY